MNIFAKKLQLAVLVMVLALAPAVLHGPAKAQDAQPPIVLGVVDFDLIMNDSKASKGLKDQYEGKRKALDKEYQKELKDFRAKEKALADQRSTLSDADFKKKVDALDAEGKEIEKKLADKRRALETSLNKSIGQIRTTLLEIASGIATKRGMTLVLNKSNIILAAEGYDFTDEAMKQLNAKLPSVK